MSLGFRKRTRARKLERERELSVKEGKMPMTVAPTGHVGVASRKTYADTSRRQNRSKTYTISNKRVSISDIPTMVVTGTSIVNLSSEDKKKMSVRNITSSSIDPTDDNGVNSRWLGVSEDVQCKTCTQGLMSCPGHYGLVNFPPWAKVYHPLQMNYIILVLRSVCRGCGEMLLTPENLKAIGVEGLNLYERLNLIAEHSKGIVRCPMIIEDAIPSGISDCDPNPQYLLKPSSDTQKVLWRSRSEKSGRYELEIDEVFKILSAISDESARRLGFSCSVHPKDMILESILVPPICVRFPLRQGAVRGSNGLTDKYAVIVKRVNELDQSKPGETVRNLAGAIKELMVSSENLSGKTSSAQSAAIKNLLDSKSGLIRGNITAKRVASSARSVITPEVNLEADEVKIPSIITNLLTVDETVNTLNKEAMTRLLTNNKVTHINNRVSKNADQILKVGDIVTRHIQNGDMVMLNRQPSLHKESMMAHRVKIGPGLTFGLHLSATSPYNADFDGDEMNLHVPQTVEAMAEMREISGAKACIMNAQSNRPNLGLVYDAVVSAFLLTDHNTLVKETLFMDSLSTMKNPPVLSELRTRVEGMGQLFKTKVKSEINITGEAEVILSENFRVDLSVTSGLIEMRLNMDSLREVLKQSDFPKLAGTRVFIDTSALYSSSFLLVRRVKFDTTGGTLSLTNDDHGKFLLYSDTSTSGDTLSLLPGVFKIRNIRTSEGVRKNILFSATPFQVNVDMDTSNSKLPDGSSIAVTYVEQSDYEMALRNPDFGLFYTLTPTSDPKVFWYYVHHSGTTYNQETAKLLVGKLKDIPTLDGTPGVKRFIPDTVPRSGLLNSLPGETLTGHAAYLEEGSLKLAKDGGRLLITRSIITETDGVRTFTPDDVGTDFIIYSPERKDQALSTGVSTVKGALSAKGNNNQISRLNFQTYGYLRRKPVSDESGSNINKNAPLQLLSKESKRIPIASAPADVIGKPVRLDLVSFDKQTAGEELVVTKVEFLPENSGRIAETGYLVSTRDRVDTAAIETQYIIGRVVKIDGSLNFVNNTKSDLSPVSENEVGYSGRALFAALLPSDFNYRSKNNHQLEDVIIHNGVIIQGQLTKNQVGPTGGSIIQYLYHQYGEDVTIDFISNAYLLLTRWLSENMYSTGLEDCLPGPDMFGFTDIEDEATKLEMEKVVPNFSKIKILLAKKQEVLTKTKLKLESLGPSPTDPRDLKKWTADISAAMNIANSAGLGISRDVLDKSNPFNVMYQSGGKGSAANISQMIALVSQQFFEGQIMPMTMGGNRCLPYFEPGSTDPRARGFCTESFTSGLDLPGWIFAMMAGRPQILETVLRTADAGTLQRYMTTAMSDITVTHDGTVRTSNGKIISFTYGGDNLEGSQLLKVNTSLGMYRTFTDIWPEVQRLNSKYTSVDV